MRLSIQSHSDLETLPKENSAPKSITNVFLTENKRILQTQCLRVTSGQKPKNFIFQISASEINFSVLCKSFIVNLI